MTGRAPETPSVESFLPHLNLGLKLTSKYLMTLPSSVTAVKISSTGKQHLLPDRNKEGGSPEAVLQIQSNDVAHVTIYKRKGKKQKLTKWRKISLHLMWERSNSGNMGEDTNDEKIFNIRTDQQINEKLCYLICFPLHFRVYRRCLNTA